LNNQQLGGKKLFGIITAVAAPDEPARPTRHGPPPFWWTSIARDQIESGGRLAPPILRFI
jgi:hypothetical protein